MKHLLIFSLLLTACAAINPQDSTHPSDIPTQSEINMAAQMGITVEELRKQTPQQHMEMMMKMQQQ